MLNVLQALLAFAVTMLGLATVVTLLLEMMARFTQRRGRVFAHMLKLVFEKEVSKHIDVTGTKEELKSFQDEIRNSPYQPEKDDSSRISAIFKSCLLFGLKQSNEMTLDEFIRRFARSQYGKKLHDKFSGRTEEVIEQLSLRYEEVAAASRDYVKNSSAVISLFIGIFLAYAANVDGYRLLQFYLGNPEVAASVGGKAEAYLTAYDTAQEKLDRTLQDLENASADTAPALDDAKSKAIDEVQAIRRGLEDAKSRVQELEELGLPIGADFFPHCLMLGEGQWTNCADQEAKPGDWVDWFRLSLGWFLSVFVTGIMIGLGGPFWYDAVRGLMRATQMLRGRPPSDDSKAAAGKETPTPKPVEIFDKHVDKAGPSAHRGALHRPAWSVPSEG